MPALQVAILERAEEKLKESTKTRRGKMKLRLLSLAALSCAILCAEPSLTVINTDANACRVLQNVVGPAAGSCIQNVMAMAHGFPGADAVRFVITYTDASGKARQRTKTIDVDSAGTALFYMTEDGISDVHVSATPLAPSGALIYR